MGAIEHPPHRESAPPHCTVLVVDDAQDMREVLAVILSRHGFKVQTAENGVDALMQLDAHRCDAVLTDLWMPEMDGLELMHQLRGRSDLCYLPVIMMTAGFENLPAATAEADFLLKKPFDYKTLMRLLSRVQCVPEHPSS